MAVALGLKGDEFKRYKFYKQVFQNKLSQLNHSTLIQTKALLYKNIKKLKK